MRLFLLIIIWSTISLPLPSFSAQAESEEIIENLIGPANLAAIAIEHHSYCLELVETEFLPQKWYEASPDIFEGITPEKPEWSKINKAYELFANGVCGHMEYEQYRKFILKTIYETLSELGVSNYDHIPCETLDQVGQAIDERMMEETKDAALRASENYLKDISKNYKKFMGK